MHRQGGGALPTLRTGGQPEESPFALSWGGLCGGSRLSGAAGMIAGDSLTGWDGAGVQARGLLPGNEGDLEAGNMGSVERAVGTLPGMEEDEQVTRGSAWTGVLLHSHTITCSPAFGLGVERVVWEAGPA